MQDALQETSQLRSQNSLLQSKLDALTESFHQTLTENDSFTQRLLKETEEKNDLNKKIQHQLTIHDTLMKQCDSERDKRVNAEIALSDLKSIDKTKLFEEKIHDLQDVVVEQRQDASRLLLQLEQLNASASLKEEQMQRIIKKNSLLETQLEALQTTLTKEYELISERNKLELKEKEKIEAKDEQSRLVKDKLAVMEYSHSSNKEKLNQALEDLERLRKESTEGKIKVKQ